MAVIPALGTILQVKHDGGSSFVTVGQVLELDFPKASVTEVDTSHLTSGQYITRRPGRTDPGEVSFRIIYDTGDTEHQYLRSQMGAPKLLQWNIIAPTTPATGETFTAFVKECNPTAGGPDENLEADLTLSVSGAFTPYTPPA